MSPPVRVLELRSVRGTGGGPEKTILLGAARADPARVAVTVCYIRDARDPLFAVGDRAGALGVDYLELRERHSLDPRIWRPLRRLAAERQIDIVHAHDYKTDLLAWLLARRTRVVPLSTAHGWTGHSLREQRLYYPADKFLLARFPHVIAVSGQVREELLAHGASPDRVTVILNGIDAARYHRDPARVEGARSALGLAPSDLSIAAVGRLEPQKRFDLLLQAVSELRHRYAGLRLFLAGEGSRRQALESEIDARGLQECCRLLGHVDDISTLHHAADLFVQSADYEGTPNAVLEAMAFEVPIIATDAGGTREIVRDRLDGLIVPRGHPEKLASAIAEVIEQRDLALVRARQARRRVETELSFEARMRHVEAIYAELAPGDH